ncbi:uncharacterized protein LOC108675535 [Hyalella azteca]|uniref:Uncharacterized protein LOC108675535 n=1 Tax=Hyalella azteca TaxID=294128 RepID=A0A8B7NYZ2_HYAAZ|nr:uncharacterized protein LOC108675535 [Hyalella azteca]
MEGQQGEKDKRKPKCHPMYGWHPSSTILTVVVMIVVLSVVAVVLSYHHYHSTSSASTTSFNNLVEGWLTPPKRYTKTWSTAYNFSDDVAKLCAGSPRRLPPYGGLPSFFDALLNPDAKFCFAWLKFGGELNFINKMISQNGDQCVNGLYGSKYVCFNPEYRMNEDPCLVYAFSHPTENQFEKDMELFSCQVHSFVSYKLCAGSPRRLPPYGGLPSFFAALLNPDAKFCFAWLKFGGELNFINKMISQSGDQCVNGLYGSKYVCFNPEYRMNEDPCLVYAFSHPTENQFEKDMELFSCQVHSFVSYKVRYYK